MAGIPLTRELVIIRTQLDRTRPRGKYSALNAADGLDKAWALRTMDEEMALFRAVTAEEEASSALFWALKRRGYPGSKMLIPRNHLHKAAVSPFLRGVINELKASKPSDVAYSFTHNPNRSDHGYTMIIQKSSEERIQAWRQEELLAFTTRVNGKAEDFLKAATAAAVTEGEASIVEHLKTRANLRNLALYASEEGRPRFRGHLEKYLLAMRIEVYRILLLFVIIDLERRRQEFVQQALSGFLRLLEALKQRKDPQDENLRG